MPQKATDDMLAVLRGLLPEGLNIEGITHWTGVIGRAQQLMLEHATAAMMDATTKAHSLVDEGVGFPTAPSLDALSLPGGLPTIDAARLAELQADFWSQSMGLWRHFIDPSEPRPAVAERADQDRRFSAAQWRDQPIYDLLRQIYLLVADHMMRSVTAVGGDDKQREMIRFATQAFVDAMSPSNFAVTNPLVLERITETRGESLIRGLEHLLTDLRKGQMTHSAKDAFEVGRDIAATPGKVVHETPLYQLIQYTPTTETVRAVPLLIFPPWINRFYILDLNAKNSFIRWAVEQGITVFVVSWKSADSSMMDVTMDDYVVRGQIDAIDAVRDILGVESVHAIGYCVAGTALAMGLSYLAAKGEAAKVASATFFTAQVDFTEAGDLNLFIRPEQLALIQTLGAEKGYLDGRYMAATFNILRGRDLIWNYVVENYLLGQDYKSFDLLHWNGDTTNLPVKWHIAYLEDLYRDNKLVKPGGVSIDGVPIDLTRIETPAYVQAGREDHIAPAPSVWKLLGHLRGPARFVLAGSGHIAGVVNPPAAKKYQYWTNPKPCDSLDAFITGAKETQGSWWPDWLNWLDERSGGRVPAKRARIPGKGKRKAIEDAPGRYVRMR